MSAKSPGRKALFLDRDGTLIRHIPYLHKSEEVELLPGTREGLRLARDAGYLLFLFTNQSGVGRGYFSLDDVRKVNTRMLELLGLGSDLFTEICIAPEHPDASAVYRKPSPRFILEMIARHHLQPSACWMIGDAPSDWAAGRAAGISSVQIRQAEAEPEAGLVSTSPPTLPGFPSILSFLQTLET